MGYTGLGVYWKGYGGINLNKFIIDPQDTATDSNAHRFLMSQFLMGKAFITLAQVVEINGPGEIVSVKPMVDGYAGNGDRISNSIIYGIPVWRLQRGSSAVVMPPVVGDIGIIAICDRDISAVKSSKSSSLPGSGRTHSYSDAIYLGGVLNQNPTQVVSFGDSGIEITSPLKVTVNSETVTINAKSKASINAPQIELNGDVSQGSGSLGGNATFGGSVTATGEVTGSGVKLSTHTHGGVQSGNNRTTGPGS